MLDPHPSGDRHNVEVEVPGVDRGSQSETRQLFGVTTVKQLLGIIFAHTVPVFDLSPEDAKLSTRRRPSNLV